MNVADSQRLAVELEALGYRPSDQAEESDVIVLNACVVRQSAENKAYNRLRSLEPLKSKHPTLVIAVMGCLVGHRDPSPLRERFPFVDVFLPPSEPQPLVHLLRARQQNGTIRTAGPPLAARPANDKTTDSLSLIPPSQRGRLVTCNVPIIYGCNHACSYCIVPSRRGRERSRPLPEIKAGIESLVAQGLREVTLVGQIVDRYGYDLPGDIRLQHLLRSLSEVDGLYRIRFLTSHPSYMTDDVLNAVAELDKVCEHIEVPVQAGDDDVLRSMRRGYTVSDYRRLIDRIRIQLPTSSIATDIIVGFPDESHEQFQRTYDLLEDLELDKAHIAMYSPRPGTLAAAKLADNIPRDVKKQRWKALDRLQTEIAARINSCLVGEDIEILVEDKHKGKWRGRTRTNKLVFFADDGEWGGALVTVRITWAGAWWMQGTLTGEPAGYVVPQQSRSL